jgi:hypothetical protein
MELPWDKIALIADFSVYPAWLAICWICCMKHQRDYQPLLRHAGIGLLLYSFSIGFALFFWSVLFRSMFNEILLSANQLRPQLTTAFWVYFSLSSAVIIIYGTSCAVWLGWAVSPGGMRLMFLPIALLLRRWPLKFATSLPVPPEEAVPWDASSRKMAIFVFILTCLNYGIVLTSVLYAIHIMQS